MRHGQNKRQRPVILSRRRRQELLRFYSLLSSVPVAHVWGSTPGAVFRLRNEQNLKVVFALRRRVKLPGKLSTKKPGNLWRNARI